MASFDTAHLIYLVLLGAAVAGWFFAQNTHSLGKLAQQALIWGLIFLGVIAVVGMWDGIRSTVAPRQSVLFDQGVIELPRSGDGHFYVLSKVNGAPVKFVVDTGATGVVLTRKDAQAAGIDPDSLVFTGRANTANGTVRTAPVRLDSFAIGEIKDSGVRAMVNDGEMDGSLLGMSYLSRYSSVEIAGDRMILRR